MLAEVATTDISIEEQPKNYTESEKIAKRWASIAKQARKTLEQETRRKAISSQNARNLRQLKVN
jgi:hypothetical protein